MSRAERAGRCTTENLGPQAGGPADGPPVEEYPQGGGGEKARHIAPEPHAGQAHEEEGTAELHHAAEDGVAGRRPPDGPRR